MAHWVTVPSGWAINLDQVVIAEAMRWTTGTSGEPLAELTLIVPGGGLQSEYSETVIPATYTLRGDDALAVWWWSRDLPALTVPDAAREAAYGLRPGQLREVFAASAPPDDDGTPDSMQLYPLG